MYLAKVQLLELNETYGDLLFPLGAEWSCCLQGSEGWLNCRRRTKSKVRRQLEDLKQWLPFICAITGMLIVESTLAFFPWKVLGLILAGGAAIYITKVLCRTDKKSCACNE